MKRLNIFLLVITTIIICIIVYGYNSGSCQIDKIYECDNNFCLYKEFQINLNKNLKEDVNFLLNKDDIQKRVTIKMYPENIFNCAISTEIGLKLYPTDLKMPTSCAILIYEKENDWINWHYDYNYYNGRFFTVLIPITNELTCTKFQFKNKDNEIISMDLTNNAICFEGNYLYHRASKLCKNQKRVILSCQYVTDNSMSFINKMRIKIKDFAYTGNLF